MSKFIRVTEQACGEEKIIFTSSISEIAQDKDRGSIIYYNDDSRFFTKESLEQIEDQLLRDEFAKYALIGVLTSSLTLGSEQSAYASYKLSDVMLKERLK